MARALTAQAGLLDAAKGNRRAGDLDAIYRHHAVFEAAAKPLYVLKSKKQLELRLQ